MPKFNKLYIAYGSNLNLTGMERRCPTADIAGTAVLKDYGLLFRNGLATVEPKQGAEVPVLVWDIRPRDEKYLDAYEGYPVLYRKENLTVELDGQPVEAMVYIMNEGHQISRPSKYYLEVIREGYRSAGFDENILDNAVQESMKLSHNPFDLNDKLYIAYGSNINREQMRQRCPTATYAGKSMLEDYELLFRGGVACVEPKPGAEVPVLLWKLRPLDERVLNLYEQRYHQEEMTIKLNGKPTEAMIYIMDEGYSLSPPHTAYYNTILKGYRAAGFDKEILDAAVHESAVRFEPPKFSHNPESPQLRLGGMDEMKWW